jgi:hypothetical protein
MFKWIVILFVVIFLLAVVGLAIVARGENLFEGEFFFNDWEIAQAGQTQTGYIQAVLTPPEGRESKIKAVIVQINPYFQTLTAYWYFDEDGTPRLYKVNPEGKYERDKKGEEGCIKCHKKPIVL